MTFSYLYSSYVRIFQKYLDEKTILTNQEPDRIRSFAVNKKLRKKQYLLQEGDIWKYDAFITKGCMRTYSVDEKGNEPYQIIMPYSSLVRKQNYYKA